MLLSRLPLVTLLALIAAAGGIAASPPAEPPAIGYSVASGDVTDTRAMIWTRTSGAASVRVEYHTSPTLGGMNTPPVPAEQDRDFTVKIDLSNLQPETRYYYRVTAESGGRRAVHSLVGTFRTAPAASEAADLTLAWGADTSERFQPFRIFDAILAQDPDVFLFAGDTVYADIDCNARTLVNYRACYRRNREDQALQRFARKTAVWAVWDDHEVANNFDRTHARLPIGRQALLEYWPIRQEPSDPARLYRSFRWGRLAEVFVLDDRQYRSPSSVRDTAAKTMLGSIQKAWLMQSLRQSDAPFKIVVSSVPLKYHGTDSWEGYTAEREELFDSITRHVAGRVIVLTGDVHYAAVLRHRTSVIEAIVGPLAMFINRRQPAAGKPETEFSYNGGFTFGVVRLTASIPRLAIEIYDVGGKLLHRSIVEP